MASEARQLDVAGAARGAQGVALGMCMGVLVMTGVAAARAFPAMRGLSPSLPDYPAQIDEHWKIAAGRMMNPVFLTADWVAIVLGVIALGALGLEWFGGRRGALSALRALLTLAMVALLLHQALVFHPTMAERLEAFSTAAIAGRVDAALEHRAAFDDMHPTATRLLGATFSTALVAGLATVASCGLGRRSVRGAP